MVITEQSALNEICEHFKKAPFLMIDTEFLREKTYYPTLCLIQIGDPDKKAVAIDPFADGLDLSPVFDLLNDPNILKVFHAGRQDLEIFYEMTGKVVHPIFDTQIAAMVCGYGDSVGYESLVKQVTGHQLDKSSQYTNWSNRPLSQKQIDYALGDVTHLVDVYKALFEELEKRNRSAWLKQEEEVLSNPEAYQNDPYESWKRIKIKSPKAKTLAILRELSAWREKRAQDKNIPRPWVLRDETLADMAAQAPKDKKGLSKIRNMPAGVVKGKTAQQLLDLIGKAVATDPSTWPQPKPRKPPPSPAAKAKMDMLKMLLKIQAAQHEVAPKMIANKNDIEALATEDHADVPAMKGWRYEIFGKDVEDFKTGKIALGLKNGEIVKHKL